MYCSSFSANIPRLAAELQQACRSLLIYVIVASYDKKSNQKTSGGRGLKPIKLSPLQVP